MILDDLGSIGSIISGIAVVVSLIYLAIQIRQNTEAERTSTYQSIVSDFGAMNNNIAGNPELLVIAAATAEVVFKIFLLEYLLIFLIYILHI